MNIQMYSVKEVAKMNGISERRVRKLLAEGRMKGRKVPFYISGYRIASGLL